MKERIVCLFLFAMGSIKVYENYAEDEMNDEDTDGMMINSKKTSKIHGKRSVDDLIARWDTNRYHEELVEAVNALSRGTIDCAQVADNECSCRRLSCFGGANCVRNESQNAINERFVRCRQTIIWNEMLCECKRFISETNPGNPSWSNRKYKEVGANSNNLQYKKEQRPISQKEKLKNIRHRVGGRFDPNRIQQNQPHI